MRPIQMVDLKQQYLNIKPEIDKAVLDVLGNCAYINGPEVNDFKKDLEEYLNVEHVIPCANGTDALQIAMMALDLKPGDEVITPSFTYIATVEVIALLGLKPVFVDVDPDTFCINPEEIRKAISKNTRVIVPVHLYGQAAPMEEIMLIAKEHDLFVIEDNAQAIGCDYHFPDGKFAKTGTLGTIGTTSFFPSKNLGGYGDGGAMTTNDSELAKKLKMIANHGQSKKYYHDMVGCNSRLDTLQAAILKVKLNYLDKYIDARQKVADVYDKAFEGHDKIKTPARAHYSNHVFHQYTIKLEGTDRNGLQQFLSENGVPSMIYYPLPGHKQKMFSKFKLDNLKLPVTDMLTEKVISLPIHTEMDPEQQDFIIKKVLEFTS